MTTPDVLTQTLSLANTGRGTVNLSRLQSGGDSGFGQVMKDSLKQQAKTPEKGVDAVKQNTSPGKAFTAKQVTEKAENTENVVSTETPSKEISSDVAKEAETAVKDLVKEELGLTDEELEAAMAVLGLEFLDLLQPENMKALLLQVNQAEPMELLTNESLAEQLTTLLQGCEEILAEKDLAVAPEELPELVDSLKDGLAQPEKPEDAQQPQTAPEAENEPKVEITVEKEGSSKKPEKADKEPEKEAAGKEETFAVGQTKESPAEEKASHSLLDTAEHGREQNEPEGEMQKNPLDLILQNLSKNVSPDEVAMTGAQKAEVMREIVNQVLEQIRITVKADTSSMELTLNPENLGKVSLKVVAADGHLTASFTTQNQVTKEALESQIQTLKENLNNQGIKVDAIEVNIQSFAFDERNQMNGGQEQGGQSKPKERKLTAEDISRAFGEEPEEEEILSTADITQSGSNVDYTA